MLRAMYTGVSGLRTHQSKMDVIGNNIANVNTVGYKRSTATFKELFTQTLQGASGAQGGLAGTNPQQVGLGVTQGATTVIHTQGAAQTTDNPLDAMIDGNSFFMVSNDPGFLNRFYTRAGNFQIDEQGTLATPDGYKVLGYKMNDDGTVSQEPGELIVNKADTMEPTTTKNIDLLGNLNSNMAMVDGTGKLLDAEARTRYMDTRIYDSLGNSYTVKLKVFRDAIQSGTPGAYTGYSNPSWKLSLDSIKDANGQALSAPATPALDPVSVALTFGVDGNFTGVDTANLKITGATDKAFGTKDPATGLYDGTIKIDLSKITQYGTDFTIEAKRKDGNTAGSVDSFAINNKGELVARYTNGEPKVLGILALAKFENNAGLEKVGGNLYQDSRNSGDPVLGRAGQQGYGTISNGRLEMSNVDLSYEFTEMITTQRGFQANSRIISTSDEILQELVNLKR
ncbi:flagellar hook protein FlgE [Andreesenia angusta]|uniref:Flagellar hook protein FlgE n=1 Tax=Andreesenia angusta TaxID=39480 RepID=A0A1S1V839_9FIRM|nr:flagellar hook protein FlgE [Andreesenia angusta]OHW62763.1 flagellar hook protein FlgE [Andreesenia angusta]